MAVTRIGAFCLAGLAAACGALPSVHAQRAVGESQDASIELEAPRQELPAGERLSYAGRWMGIPVGHGWIELNGPVDVDGRPAYTIEAHGQSNNFLSKLYPIHDILRSTLDAKTLQPVTFEKSQSEGHYRAEEAVTFDYTRGLAVYRSLINERSVKEVPIPNDVQDLLSTLYWLRRQPITVGRPLTVPIYTDEKVYLTDIRPLETLQLELLWRGTFPCVMVEPMAAFKGVFVRRGRVWAYLSADARRLPLFMKISTPWGLMTAVIDPESLASAVKAR